MSISSSQIQATSTYLLNRLQMTPADSSATNISTTPITPSSQTGTASPNVNTEDAYFLMLKDSIQDGGYIFSSIAIQENELATLSTHLETLRDHSITLAGLEDGSAAHNAEMARALDAEADMSRFIGDIAHGQSLQLDAVFSTTPSSYQFLEFVDTTAAGSDSTEPITAQISAVEVDFKAIFETYHNPQTCPHCEAMATSAQNSDVQQPYASTTYDGNGAGAVVTGATGESDLETLRMGNAWDVGEGDTLSYSYYDGSVQYDPAYNANSGTPGTPSGVDAAGSGNSSVLDKAFDAWDDTAAFEFSKVTESGSTVGDLRVAFTDQSSGAAAFAYGPGDNSVSGDIFFETEDINTNGNAVDFSEDGIGTTGFNYYAALHEIGHALGLSHPFDGGSTSGATLDLSKDYSRNTVMSYVQTDRSKAFSVVDNGDGTFAQSTTNIYASTPGMLDMDFMDAVYGAETNSSRTGGDNIYQFADGVQTIQVITDSGGSDGIDGSLQTRKSIINLNPGSFSSIGLYTEAEQKTYWAGQTGLSESQIQDWFDTLDSQASAANSYYAAHDRKAIYTGEHNVGIANGTLIEMAMGGGGDDEITGNYLANQFQGHGGDDTIDGGDGDDLVIYANKMSDYTISTSGGTTTVTHNNNGADGSDTLTNVEYMQFAPEVMTSTAATAVSGAVTAQNLEDADNDFKISIDGGAAVTVVLAKVNYTTSGGVNAFAADLEEKINRALSAGGQGGGVTVTANSPLTFTSGSFGANSSIAFSDIASDLFAALGVSDASGMGMTITDGQNPSAGPTYYTVADGSTSTTRPTMADGTPPPEGSSGSSGGGSSSGSGSSGSSSLETPAVIGTISSISVATGDGAREAISIIDGAINQVSEMRGQLGAVVNRLDYAITSMSNSRMHTTASQSRIVDADMAVETSKLVKGQILRQSAQYVLSASYMSGQNALGLLR